LGIVATQHPGSALDQAIHWMATAGLALPSFWLGLVLQIIFYRQLGWLPLDSRIDLFLGAPPARSGLYLLDSLLSGDLVRLGNSIMHLILPTITLALPAMGAVARMTRASVLDTLGEDYVRTALAKGANARRVLWRHVLRNALLPVVTLIGNMFNAMLAGVFVVEVIFNWPGLGWYATRVILAADYASVVSITLVIGILCTVVNFAVDLLYRKLDPRIQLT
jgi:peptide/nickel transport system permease protein